MRPLPPAAIPMVTGLLAVAVVGLALILTFSLGAFLMKPRTLLSLAAAAAVLMVAACSPISKLVGAPGGGIAPAVLGNLQGCSRHYEGALGVGLTGSFRIDCQPQPVAPTEAPAPAAP